MLKTKEKNPSKKQRAATTNVFRMDKNSPTTHSLNQLYLPLLSIHQKALKHKIIHMLVPHRSRPERSFSRFRPFDDEFPLHDGLFPIPHPRLLAEQAELDPYAPGVREHGLHLLLPEAGACDGVLGARDNVMGVAMVMVLMLMLMRSSAVLPLMLTMELDGIEEIVDDDHRAALPQARNEGLHGCRRGGDVVQGHGHDGYVEVEVFFAHELLSLLTVFCFFVPGKDVAQHGSHFRFRDPCLGGTGVVGRDHAGGEVDAERGVDGGIEGLPVSLIINGGGGEEGEVRLIIPQRRRRSRGAELGSFGWWGKLCGVGGCRAKGGERGSRIGSGR